MTHIYIHWCFSFSLNLSSPVTHTHTHIEITICVCVSIQTTYFLTNAFGFDLPFYPSAMKTQLMTMMLIISSWPLVRWKCRRHLFYFFSPSFFLPTQSLTPTTLRVRIQVSASCELDLPSFCDIERWRKNVYMRNKCTHIRFLLLSFIFVSSFFHSVCRKICSTCFLLSLLLFIIRCRFVFHSLFLLFFTFFLSTNTNIHIVTVTSVDMKKERRRKASLYKKRGNKHSRSPKDKSHKEWKRKTLSVHSLESLR